MVIQPITTAVTGGAALNAQSNYTNQANSALTAGGQQAEGYQSPYLNLGSQAAGALSNDLTSLTTPVSMTQSQLDQTPGYQFQLGQGLKSVQNNQNAQGLGVSGSAQKAAANYATGLANSNYQQQFENAVTNQNNIYSRLMGVTGLGQAAGTTAGNAALGTASGVANNLTGLGNANAAYYNSIGGSVNNSMNSLVGLGALAGSSSNSSLFGSLLGPATVAAG